MPTLDKITTFLHDAAGYCYACGYSLTQAERVTEQLYCFDCRDIPTNDMIDLTDYNNDNDNEGDML